MNNKSQENVQGDYLHYSSAAEILSPIDAAGRWKTGTVLLSMSMMCDKQQLLSRRM